MERFQGTLEPLPYHQQVAKFLRTEMAELWNWFETNRLSPKFSDNVRAELKKVAFPISREQQSEVYDLAELAALELGITCPVTLYQGPNAEAMNAALAFCHDECCIVLQGSVTQNLSNNELMALFSHELGHHLLWSQQDQMYFLADQILSAQSASSANSGVSLETFRRWQLFSEIYCDRAALRVVEDPKITVSMLVKMQTGQSEVDAESYLNQAHEITTQIASGSSGETHPEAYIRTRALRLWAEEPASANEKIAKLLEGPQELESLDFLEQQKLLDATRELIELFLQPDCMQTEAMLALARGYFADFAPVRKESKSAKSGGERSKDPDSRWSTRLARLGPSLHNYFCFVLLDFVNSDRDLEDRPLIRALAIADRLQLKDRLLEMAKRELRLRKRQLDSIVSSKSLKAEPIDWPC